MGWLFLAVMFAVAPMDGRVVGGELPESANQNTTAPPIRASGDTVHRWMIGSSQASLLIGDCLLQHQGKEIRADKILIVADGPRGLVRNRLVIEGRVLPDGKKESTPRTAVWMTNEEPMIQAPQFRREPKQRPFLMQYLPSDSIDAVQASASPQPDAPIKLPLSDSNIQQVQYSGPQPGLQLNDPNSGLPLLTDPPPPTVFEDGSTTGATQFFIGGNKSVEISGRSSTMPPLINVTPRPETNEQIITARGGVTVRIRDVTAQLPSGQFMQLGTVTLSADRVVAWTPPIGAIISGATDISESEGEIYLEGDVVFRQGENVIYADSMYYNATRETGLILDAEAITTVPEFQGVVRLKAEVLQAIAKGNYRAFDAAVTTSRMGVPRYWLQSEQLDLTQRTRNVIDARGQVRTERDPHVRSSNNFLFLGGVPVLYWPRFSTSLTRPVFYISGAKVRNDSAFGTQVLLDWDVFQLLGIDNAPKGIEWELSTDYLSDRGPALGTQVEYDLPGLFGVPGPTRGTLDIWGIADDGVDRLGLDRLALVPEKDIRGRVFLRHRQNLGSGYEFIAESGLISDRNFYEQFLENEWDQSSDHQTGLRLRRRYHNQLVELGANVQVNDFFQETERLPELNHYLLGGTFLGQRLTWSMHNHVSHTRLNVADAPEDPAEALENSVLPGEVAAGGIVASTRQELALPFPVGPWKVRPVASVDVAHFGEDVNGESLTRLLGQAGVAIDLPMMRVDPTIQSSLFNMNGLAHKVNWKAEYWYADSDTDLTDLPYYDALDDNAQEQFRRRFIGDLYGGTLPDRFDPRTYAFRNGVQQSVTSPSDTIADDLQQFRFGLNQRFQTKRGLPGRERIVDMIQLDFETTLFPKSDRDNFGETLGPTTYDFRYHIGDRYSLLSDGYIDFFDDGLRSISAGVRTSRPGVGDYYVGLLSLEGPISSTVFRTSMDYRLNEKWILSGGTAYDLGETGNIGQSYGLTRIGESMLVRVNVNVDSGRDNVGVGFLIEPRFFSRTLGHIGGGLIPPPGIEGLE